MSAELLERAEGLAAKLVAWRRDLHRHPELAYRETRTAGFVAERLRALGLEVREGVGRTGVVGVIHANGAEGSVMLRADMDALPLREVEGREYGSTVPGRMHACGHDGHTAMLLGAAEILVSRKDDLPRDVVLCFQPAEEGHGGARAMIEDGLLDDYAVGETFGLHLWSPFPAGTVHVRPGPMMASQDEFTARILGRGGHGALPHQARDPIVAAALAVTAIQSVVARAVDPAEPAVVHVGSLHAGDAPNIVPDRAVLEGTLRAFHPQVRETVRARTRQAVEGAATAAGCSAEFELRPGYPALVNEPRAAARLSEVARGLLGGSRVFECAPVAAAEDFAYFLERVPGAFAFLGAGNVERGITAPHHSPEFDIDESALPVGAALLAALALGG